MANNEKVAEFAPMDTLAFGSITGTYAIIGTANSRPVVLLEITNLTNEDMIISTDAGVAAGHIIVPSNGSKTYDVRTNNLSGRGFSLQKGEGYYAKRAGGSDPTSGSVYLTRIYGNQ